MRQPVVAGNWKMNGSKAMALGLCGDLVASAQILPGIDVILCPPATLLGLVSEQLASTKIQSGAQDIDPNPPGAHTGQISAELAKGAGARFCIIGHSERRINQAESSQLVAEKMRAAQCHDLTPILCLGETQAEREQEQTEKVIAEQLDAVIQHCGIAAFNQAIIAYEPVWAIGTGLTASPEQAQQVHQFIRERLSQHDSNVAAACRILYGGSMKPENAADLMAQPDIDGGLIGGASLKSQDFLNICTAAIKRAADRN